MQGLYDMFKNSDWRQAIQDALKDRMERVGVPPEMADGRPREQRPGYVAPVAPVPQGNPDSAMIMQEIAAKREARRQQEAQAALVMQNGRVMPR